MGNRHSDEVKWEVIDSIACYICIAVVLVVAFLVGGPCVVSPPCPPASETTP